MQSDRNILKKVRGKEENMLLSLLTVGLCSWGEKEEGEEDSLPSFLSVCSCSLQLSPLQWPRPDTARTQVPVGGRGREPHRKQEIMREREEAMGVRDGGSRNTQQLPLLVWKNDRERKWKFGWLHLVGLDSQLPARKQSRKVCHNVGTYLLFSPPPITHTATVTVTTTQRELPLSLFCHQIRGVQTRHSPRYDSTRCHVWKAVSPLNTLSSMKGRQNSGSHCTALFLVFLPPLVFLFVWSSRLPPLSRPEPSVRRRAEYCSHMFLKV